MRFLSHTGGLAATSVLLLAASIAVGPSWHGGPPAALAQDGSCTTETAKDKITDAEAQTLYDCIADALLAAYQGSGVDAAAQFRDWTRASTVPFVSATHGGRYVIHYINDVGAEAYLEYEKMPAGGMPVGSFAAKESFAVNEDGAVVVGPLFLMEKVAAGGLPDTADWRYSLILPNGQIMGTTGGENADKVQFCHACHLRAPENQDALLLPKPAYRVVDN